MSSTNRFNLAGSRMTSRVSSVKSKKDEDIDELITKADLNRKTPDADAGRKCEFGNVLICLFSLFIKLWKYFNFTFHYINENIQFLLFDGNVKTLALPLPPPPPHTASASSDDITMTPTPTPNSDSTWLEMRENEQRKEEESKFDKYKRGLRKNIKKLRTTVEYRAFCGEGCRPFESSSYK